ncbi:MAG: sensor domain-containing protein [Mycobacterium sp.]
MRRFGVSVVLAWAVCLVAAGCVSSVAGTAVAGRSATRPSTAPRIGLPGLLLSLDEMRHILKFSSMATEETWARPDERGVFQPVGCVGAVFSGMARTYDGSQYREFYEVRHVDVTSDGWQHWVDQGAVSFESPDAALAFVSKEVARWRQCAGQKLRYAFPLPEDWQEPYLIGQTVDSGCVTMVSNVIAGDNRYDDIRVLAAKSNIVVDLQFTGFDLTDEPTTAVNEILDRIASGGRDCAFWG